jgi:recombination associated protein RdgC
MLFKQIQIIPLQKRVTGESFTKRLEDLLFTPCLPSSPSTMGWVSPVDDDLAAPPSRTMNGCVMLCMQIEEKILPASVVAVALKEKVKKLEAVDSRKIRQKEKLSLKDEVYQTLLPRAFTKLTRIYGYIDTRNNWLVLNCTSPSKAEAFISLFKKTAGDDSLSTFDITKPAAVLTTWLRDKDYPKNFSIEKSCVLQDPNQQNRMIRAQQQDLFVDSIQQLVKDGCEVMQLGLCWQDRLNFVMSNDFTLKSITLAEDDLAEIKDEAETKREKFDADFFMMTEMYTGMITDILDVFCKKELAKAS